MALYIVGGRTEYYLTNDQGYPSVQPWPDTWPTSIADPNSAFSAAVDLDEEWGEDAWDPVLWRFRTATDSARGPFLQLVAIGKTDISYAGNYPFWYRTFLVFTTDINRADALQIVGWQQFFWWTQTQKVSEYLWGKITPTWIGIGISGDNLQARSAVGKSFLSQFIGGLGNIVIFPPDNLGGNPDIPDPIEIQGGDLPVSQQLIAVAKHDPWGWGLSQSRVYTLPATAQNPNTIPSTSYYLGVAGWSLRQRDMNMQQPLTVTSAWGRSNADRSPIMGIGQFWTPQWGWGPTVMSLFLVPEVEPPVITGGGTGTGGTGQAGASQVLVEIRHNVPTARVFYTTDGTDPGSSGTSKPYTGEFLVPITGGNFAIVRAIAVVGREAASPIASRRIVAVREKTQ